MSSWDMGYNSDELYCYHYFREMSPSFINFALTVAGVDFAPINQDFTACELGVGQGISINMFAATEAGKWYGTDFNSSQINFAQNLANSAKVNMQLHDLAFHEFAALDLPKFDYICLHGIWSWVSEQNQQIILDFIDTHLKVGGAIYISYNTKPGFTLIEPIRHLMQELNNKFMVKNIPFGQKIQDLQIFINEFLKTKPAYARQVSYLQGHINDIFKQNQNYIAGEFFNQEWNLEHFSTLAKKLENIKLNYITSCNLTKSIPELYYTKEQFDFVAPYQGHELFETLSDFIGSTQFRKDIFVKGPRSLTQQERREKLDNTAFVMIVNIEDVNYQLLSRLGIQNIDRNIAKPILQYLSDYKPHTLGEIKNRVQALHNIENGIIDDIIIQLVIIGSLEICTNTKPSQELIERCQKLNQYILTKEDIANIYYLACPYIGGAISISSLSFTILRLFYSQSHGSESDKIQKVKDLISTINNKEIVSYLDDIIYRNSFAIADRTLARFEKSTQEHIDMAINLSKNQAQSEEQKQNLETLLKVKESWQTIKENAPEKARECKDYQELVDRLFNVYVPIFRALKMLP